MRTHGASRLEHVVMHPEQSTYAAPWMSQIGSARAVTIIIYLCILLQFKLFRSKHEGDTLGYDINIAMSSVMKFKSAKVCHSLLDV